MAENSKIEWTDHTINFWWGCTKVHQGCHNCYAERDSKRYGLKLWGPLGARKRIKSAIPLAHKLNAEAARWGVHKRVFSNSMSDFFERHEGPIVDEKGFRLLLCDNCGAIHRDDDSFEPCPFNCGRLKVRMDDLTLNDLRREAFSCIDSTQNLDYLLLTKRPENVPDMWRKRPHPSIESGFDKGYYPEYFRDMLPSMGALLRPNVSLGTSISLEEHKGQIDALRACRDMARFLFLSIEPLLGPLGQLDLSGIGWVIVGGESGPNARPMHPQWARDIRDQCQAAGVPFFFKQWGEHQPATLSNINVSARDGMVSDLISGVRVRRGGSAYAEIEDRDDMAAMRRVGKKAAGRLLDGQEWMEFPEVAYA